MNVRALLHTLTPYAAPGLASANDDENVDDDNDFEDLSMANSQVSSTTASSSQRSQVQCHSAGARNVRSA